MGAAAITGGQLLTVEQAGPRHLDTDLLEARYRAPTLREGLVWRTELLDRLEGERTPPLVLVTAPAGFGKTTLLAQWSELAGRPFAWVTLTEADRDPAVLADSITIALRPTGVTGTGFVLVIDDAHRTRPEVLRDAVLDALGWLPPGSQVVIASRCQPIVPLGQMRARHMLLEVSADGLAMSAVEAAALLRNAGLDLEFTAVQELVRRTEGWPVALELAAASVAELSDPAGGLAQLAGDSHLISEYFQAEFLATVSPATKRFLIRTSVLDLMSGPLCNAVLDRTRSTAVLAQLARTNVPLRPAEPSHEWYRLHPLFREMLQTELRRAEPEMQAVLHRRAGDWHHRAGDLDRAVDHACRAGDLGHAGDLLWANLAHYTGGKRNERVQRWIDGVTAEQASGCAAFAVSAAHSHLATGSMALAEQWARSAAVALGDPAADGADTRRSAHRAGAIMVEAWAARSGAARMAQDAGRAYSLLPDDSPLRANCCFLQGTAGLLAGEDSDAERLLEEGAARGAAFAPDVASLCLAQLAVIALERDDVEVAGELTARARQLIGKHELSGYPTLALVFAASAATGVSQRRVDEAKAAAAQCMALTGLLEDFAPWYGAETRILLARASLGLGDVLGAREQLAHASRLARRTPGAVVFQRWFDDAWDRFDRRAETALIGVGSLTTAELRVLRFLPTHLSFHEIAERLHVSSNTVKSHVHAVYRKLEASSRSEAVANATGAGLIGS